MPLTHAPTCTRCGQHHTKHPSGLCHRCRGKAAGTEYLAEAISHHKDIFVALTMLQSGYSYQQIGQTIGKSKSATFALCQAALHHRHMVLPTEELQ